MSLQDQDQNQATLSGYIHHEAFQNFNTKLNISTERIMALNLPKSYDTYFYGIGFVSGDVEITGDNSKLLFFSDNIKTLSGSDVVLPMTSAMSVSTMSDVYFLPPPTLRKTEKIIEEDVMATIFDLTMDVNKDADLALDLEVIDAKLDCKTDGRFRLYYNSLQDEFGLTGLLQILSGRFNMSLMNFLPREFDVVQGGSITFNGPIESAIIDVTAMYEKQMSVNTLAENLNIGRTIVDSYIKLYGNLMNPQPGFSFAFPNVTQDQQRQLITAIDTTDQQSTLRQFFSVVFLNTFIAPNSGTTIESQASIDLLTNMFNSYISQQIKGVDIGVNIFNESESNYTEYSVNASIPLYNDRVIVRTNLGYAQQLEGEASNLSTFVGDVGIEVLINEAGNWRFKVFYANDQYEPNAESSRPTQRGGVAIIFQQQFNSRKELLESWREIRMRRKSKIQ